MPTVDTHTITVNYSDAMHLMEHLQVRVIGHTLPVCRRKFTRLSPLVMLPQGMGENGALVKGSLSSRDLLYATAAAYKAMFGDEESVPATFQVC